MSDSEDSKDAMVLPEGLTKVRRRRPGEITFFHWVTSKPRVLMSS